MSELDVKNCLLSRAISASPGAALPDAYTWYENNKKLDASQVEVVKPTDHLWYRVFFVPNDNPKTDGAGLGAMIHFTGFFQINVAEPRTKGDFQASTEAQRIQDCFKANSYLYYNGQSVFISSCGRTEGLQDIETSDFVIAIRVYFSAYVVN